MDTMPTEDLLAKYATGSASAGEELIVASQVTVNPRARSRLEALERLGGATLAGGEPQPMAADALDAVLARIDGTEPGQGRPPPVIDAPAGAGWMPAPLARAVGVPSGEIPWQFRLPGVSEHVLDGFEGEKVSLMRVRPGAAVPQHTHDGRELTLVLSGILLDDGIEYHAGDLAANTEEDDHKPQVIGTEVCHCLVVQDGGLRFTGRFLRAFNFLNR